MVVIVSLTIEKYRDARLASYVMEEAVYGHIIQRVKHGMLADVTLRVLPMFEEEESLEDFRKRQAINLAMIQHAEMWSKECGLPPTWEWQEMLRVDIERSEKVLSYQGDRICVGKE